MVVWMAEYKDITELKKQIANFKKVIHSPNGDYLTGYVCALSATEGIIAGLPVADVVEVVRCKDCKHCTVTSDGMVCENALPTKRMMDYYIYGSTILAKVEANDFCSRGERRTVSEDGK